MNAFAVVRLGTHQQISPLTTKHACPQLPLFVTKCGTQPTHGSHHLQNGLNPLKFIQHCSLNIPNFSRANKQKTKTTNRQGWRVERQTLNTMLACFTHASTVSCVMWRSPQHSNTMTMLTLNARTRRQVDGSTCRRFLILRVNKSSCCRVEDDATSRMLSRFAIKLTV